MLPELSRTWFLTWTTYGTWLPGDERSFVGNVRECEDRLKIKRRSPGVPYEKANDALADAAQQSMRGSPVWLTRQQAIVVFEQLRETATHRNWSLIASAVMSNHVHLLVTVPGDPEPAVLLRDFKAYASRALNKRFGKPPSNTWWTRSGSNRICDDDASLMTRLRYIRDQDNPLAIWLHPEYQK